jgi:large subunit ribosomal protein L25
MSIALAAKPRTATGRRAKHVQDHGNIPAVVYGKGVGTKIIEVNRAEFRQVYRKAGTSSLIDLTIEGGDMAKAVVKEVQVDPISLEPYHIDFHQIRMDEVMTAEIPLNFVGESKAVKEFAGTLVKSMDSVEVTCLPADLPHEIEVDLSVLATFEDSITVGSLKLPKGVEITNDPLATIATVTPPLTDEQMKAMEASSAVDVTAIKTEAEEKKEAEAAKKAEEAAAEGK